ncbi:hypothetical protein G6F62_012704 [Rhizopus arrhizus]|nr:hypothetical protein G6F62_012704 [Rhizopus arrhizus]
MGAALHFDLWVPNFGIQEYMRHTDETDAVFPHAYTFDQGMLYPGDVPGHGVDIDEKLAAKYPYKPAGAARLSPAGLSALPDTVARPGYDRAALRVGIVHLGLGAFARAHLAAVNEAALHAGADRGWGICGVSLRQAAPRDALAPQDGLYALALRSADAAGQPRQQVAVIGCLLETLVAPEDPQAVLARIAHADTRIVSVTVTEKGYCHDPASGRLNLDHPDIVHDLGQPLAPRSTASSLAAGVVGAVIRMMSMPCMRACRPISPA